MGEGSKALVVTGRDLARLRRSQALAVTTKALLYGSWLAGSSTVAEIWAVHSLDRWRGLVNSHAVMLTLVVLGLTYPLVVFLRQRIDDRYYRATTSASRPSTSVSLAANSHCWTAAA